MVHPFSWTKCRLLGCARPWCQPMHLLPSTFFLSPTSECWKYFCTNVFFSRASWLFISSLKIGTHWKHSCLLDFLCRNTKKLCISSFLRGNIRKLLKPVGLIFFKGDIFWVPTPKNQFLRENCKKIYKRRTKILAVSSTTLSPQLDFCDVDCWSILIVLARLGSGWTHAHVSISSSCGHVSQNQIGRPGCRGRVVCPSIGCTLRDPYRHFYIYIYISRPHCKSFCAGMKKNCTCPSPSRKAHPPMCRLLAPVPCPSDGLVCLARTRPRPAVKVVTTFCRGHFKSRPVFPSPCRPF